MRKICILPLLFLLVACNKFRYSTARDFQDNRWLKEDVQEYNVALSENLDNADISIFFSHLYEPGYSKVPVQLEITAPDGKKENLSLTLLLKDEEGKSLSDCTGDICDLHKEIKSEVSLKKGNYIFRLKNNFNNAFLPNVLAAGIEVTSIK